MRLRHLFGTAAVAAVAAAVSLAQPPGGGGGFGPPGGGFGGPPGGQERKLLAKYDADKNGYLNREERKKARGEINADGKGGGRRGGFGGMMGGRGPETKPGPEVQPGEVQNFPDKKLYDPTVLRTVFLTFDSDEWEQEMEDFHNTDVEVPAVMTVDGKTYKEVGVHFRGMSSYMGVPRGAKRSLNVSVDLADPKQRLYGYKTLNLLNAHEDGTFLSTALYSHIARQYIPAPKANLVKVVINGRSWGVYASVQQFDKAFVAEEFKSSKGTRWKVRGSPGGGGGLEYIGDKIDDYKRRYEMKSGDDEKAWKALITLCKTIAETPPDRLEAALKPMLDIDGLLWFLALDVALINCDGYWIRASDYSILRDDKGVFHFVPHDMNEAFRPAGGPGFGGGGMRIVMPRLGEVLPEPLQNMLELTAEQKKKLADLQKDVDAKLDALLTADQRKRVADMRAGGGMMAGGPPGFGGPPGGQGGPPGGGPGGPPGGPGGPGGGRGGFGGPPGGGGGGGVTLDPLYGLTDARKPLRSKILAVPALKAKYLANVRTIAEKSLDWNALGPVVASYRKLIEKEVEADTRKLSTFAEFQTLTADAAGPAARPGGRMPGYPLRAFADERRKYLLDATAEKEKKGE